MLNFDPGGRTGSESIFINYLFSAVLSWTQNNPEQASRNPKISNPFQPLLAAIHWFLSYEWTCIPPPLSTKASKDKTIRKKVQLKFWSSTAWDLNHVASNLTRKPIDQNRFFKKLNILFQNDRRFCQKHCWANLFGSLDLCTELIDFPYYIRFARSTTARHWLICK